MEIKSNSLNLISFDKLLENKELLDIEIINKSDNKNEDCMINLDNLYGYNYKLPIGVKNGILDGTVSDYTGQLMGKYRFGKINGLIYDKIYPYNKFLDLDIDKNYKYLVIKIKNIINNLDYTSMQLDKFLDQVDTEKLTLEIDITDVDLKEELELTEEDYDNILEAQIEGLASDNLDKIPTFITNDNISYNNKAKPYQILDWISSFLSKILLKNKIKSIKITSSILNNLLSDTKYYKTILNLQNLNEISIYWDLDIDEMGIIKLNKYNLNLKRLTITEDIEKSGKNANVIEFINSFNRIELLSTNSKYKNDIKSNILDIIYYNTDLEDTKNGGWIVLDNMYNIYFEDNYIIEFQNKINDEIRFNIMLNDYKDIIIINKDLKDYEALKFMSYGNINIYYIKHMKDLSFII